MMEMNDLTRIRPKGKFGPATGLSCWVLFLIILGFVELVFWMILTLDLVQLDQMEIWIVGASLGAVASITYFVLTRAIWIQGRKAGERRYGGGFQI